MFEAIASMCCGKAAVMGRRLLGIYAGCGDGIASALPSIGNAPDMLGAEAADGAYCGVLGIGGISWLFTHEDTWELENADCIGGTWELENAGCRGED